MAKSNVEIAKEVIQGKWGNGVNREKALKSAGYDYNAIQLIVNKLLKGEQIPSTLEVDVDLSVYSSITLNFRGG